MPPTRARRPVSKRQKSTVSERTFRNRVREEPEFREAYRAGRVDYHYAVAHRLKSIAFGGPISESRKACQFILSRQFGWIEKRASELSAGREGGVLVVPAMLEDPDEWERLAAAQQARAKLLTRGQDDPDDQSAVELPEGATRAD